MSSLKNIASITALAAASMAASDPLREMRNMVYTLDSDPFTYDDLISNSLRDRKRLSREHIRGKPGGQPADAKKKKARKAQGKARAKNRKK